MIYDIETTNESFLEMCEILKNEGITNNKFHLILYDNSLQGVDPFDEKNLTEEQKHRIQIEVQTNCFYFLREIVRIPEAGGFSRFMLHRGNLAQTFCMINNINVIEMLPRQHGKTIGACCVYNWIYNFATKNTNMIFGNKQLPDSKENLKRFKDITEALPSYLKTHLNPKKDTNNLEYIRCFSNNNTIKALPAPNDEAGADKAGRGLTTPIIWFDEFSFLKYNDIIYTAASPALSKASESAIKNGTPFGKLITTTPAMLDDPSGAYCYSMIDQSLEFDERWYDKTIEEVLSIIENESKNNFVYIEFTYLQLGRDEEWFKNQCKELNNDLFKIKREILLQWLLASNESIFSEEQLANLEIFSEEKHNYGKFYIKDYKFKVLGDIKNPFKKSYIISIDIAGGLSADSTVITITDPSTFKPVAEFSSNTIGNSDLVELVVELVQKMFPVSVVVPERNNGGIAFIDSLMKTSIVNNLYYEMREKKAEKVIEDVRKQNKRTVKSKVRYYGIQTDKTSRKIMIEEILYMIVNDMPEVITSRKIFNEIKTLIRTKRGKIEHRQGCHDDSLFSYLVGMYALLYGTNINKFIKNLGSGDINEDTINDRNRKTNLNNFKNFLDNKNNKNNNLSTNIIDKYKNTKFDDRVIQNEENKSISMETKKRIRNINFIKSLNK